MIYHTSTWTSYYIPGPVIKTMYVKLFTPIRVKRKLLGCIMKLHWNIWKITLNRVVLNVRSEIHLTCTDHVSQMGRYVSVFVFTKELRSIHCIANNPLWPGDAICWHRFKPTLAWVIACCLKALSLTWTTIDLSSQMFCGIHLWPDMRIIFQYIWEELHKISHFLLP